MNLVDLRGYVPAIEAHLARAYGGRARSAPRGLVEPIGLMREFTLRGGKRFRAQFVLAGYYLATGRPPTPAVPAAAAMEHFQSWMLIHDDVIDHSELRRGGPTLHRALERRHRARRREGDAIAIGQGLGITLGDLEEPLTVSALLDSPVPKERVLAAVREYARMTALTAYGQVLDIDNGVRPLEELRESDVLLVHRLKSAVYTVASPLRIGAILGGGSPGLLAGLERFGLDAGIAFQLRDDVLGAGFGSSAIGKSANDLVEGKRTLLVVRAWARSTPADRRRLRRVLGQPSASAAALREARHVIEATGALDYSERRIRTLKDRALRGLDRVPDLTPGGRRLLSEIARLLVDRTA